MTTRGSNATRFEESLDGIGVDHRRTTVGGFEDALGAVTTGATVGATLPWVDYPDWVETDPTAAQLRDADTGVTPVAFGIAETGTVAVRSRPEGDEPLSLYPERHVAVVAEADVVPDLATAFTRLEGLFADRESVVFATGASATADMGELVEGVHGPTEVRVLVVEGASGGDGGDGRDGEEETGGRTVRVEDGTGGTGTAVSPDHATNGHRSNGHGGGNRPGSGGDRP